MKKSKGFSKIQQKSRILGLEFFDFLLLILIYLIVFIVSKNLLINLGILFTAYLLLRVYKKGKPPHWWESVIRSIFTPRRYSPRRERKREIFK
jgi:hypothetical protein